MITADGWLAFAERKPGPSGKTNGGVSPVSGFVAHSAEGYESHIMNVLNDPNRQASWHFTNLYDGRLWQHYPIQAQCWASGSGQPNNNWPAMEHEGIAGQPLTDAQIATTARVIRELSQLKGWTPTRPTGPQDKNASLWEHREMVRFGSLATACPSGRIPWDKILAALGEEPMTNNEARAHLINALLHDFNVVPVAEGEINGKPTVTVELQPVDGQPSFGRFTIWAEKDVIQ